MEAREKKLEEEEQDRQAEAKEVYVNNIADLRVKICDDVFLIS